MACAVPPVAPQEQEPRAGPRRLLNTDTVLDSVAGRPHVMSVTDFVPWFLAPVLPHRSKNRALGHVKEAHPTEAEGEGGPEAQLEPTQVRRGGLTGCFHIRLSLLWRCDAQACWHIARSTYWGPIPQSVWVLCLRVSHVCTLCLLP